MNRAERFRLLLRTSRLMLAAAFMASAGSLLSSAEVSFTSPGLPPSRMDAQARLVEDWGSVGIRLAGEGLSSVPAAKVEATKLDGLTPAACAQLAHGPVSLTLQAYRAPVWPAGLDVLTARLEETSGQERQIEVSLVLPEGARLGAKTVSLGGRTVVSLPGAPNLQQTKREWGWLDDAVSLPGWARPKTDCDPAFRNIRAGLGGVPIHYRFAVAPRSAFNVVLGFCESHWAQSGQRPVVCQVEGAPSLEVDPLARWGQHQPGVLLFDASDKNGDGELEVSVLPRIGAPDLNPILNVLWVFPPGPGLNLDQVMAGKLNGLAVRYLDVGGDRDQSLIASGTVAYAVKLAPKGAQELTFLVACPGGTVPMPDQTAWTPAKLRQSALEVWRDWSAGR